ncbi:ABC transporter permease subunit [Gymnodinialimonas sp. 2305UL16-5]|uniref:ABC transporter permease n=1 Tax=Gymnodinialimonas mytili TaxID=3126503 RepID=UPI003094E7AD
MSDSDRRSLILWAGVALFTALAVSFDSLLGALDDYPDALVLPVTGPMNAAMQWFIGAFGWLFRGIAWLFDWPILAARTVLAAIPWPAMILLGVWLAWRASGPGLAIFTGLSLIYMAMIGYWAESMNSLALVLISVPLAVGIGFAVGAWGFRSERARRAIMPTLDLLQTIPAFAYLLPILLLFGFGTTVGLVASVLFAFPPMVRNTIIGLRAVPPEVVEAGLMSGARPRQLFWQVRVPTARRQLLLGVNQATMASLSMVIIAAIIGGTNDIGWEVLSTMRRAEFGESLLAGLVIALIAMALDRITAGFANQTGTSASRAAWALILGAIVAASALAAVFPVLHQVPEGMQINPAPAINASLDWAYTEFRVQLEAIKTAAFFYVMLPIKIGLTQAISPFSWGFALTPTITAWMAAILLVAATILFVSGRRMGAFALIIVGLLLYHGLTGTPWLALALIIVALAWQVGGRGLAIGAGLGIAFLLVTGIWEPSVVSLYLCGVAVIVSFGFGALIGIAASENRTVSAIVRPVIDTLQTMPLFVILIPFVMIFRIGEFTALLAIVTYAIVPAVRYTEHGLRNVPETVVEAATAIGATRLQLLWHVKLPMALPSILLGLNQTIMFAISMLVITALVGTDDLGQQIYIGLSDGDFGVGMIAGIGMAIIAMIADRITQGISRNMQARLGLKGATIP